MAPWKGFAGGGKGKAAGGGGAGMTVGDNP
jgi:hypothetical protein